jgi:hypothetical protein
MVCINQKSLNAIDFNFMEEIAYLVLAARRTLSYTDAIRYYLRGENK